MRGRGRCENPAPSWAYRWPRCFLRREAPGSSEASRRGGVVGKERQLQQTRRLAGGPKALLLTEMHLFFKPR